MFGKGLRTQKIYIIYKKVKKIVKKVASVSKFKAYNDLHNKLKIKEMRKDIFEFVRTRERKSRNLSHIDV